MLLQTNSYIVPKDKRSEHARLMRRFRQTLMRLGCDQFEVYEQVGSNWTGTEASGRYVQIMRFRDLKHQHVVQSAERNDPTAQALIAEFCELVNFTYQQQQGLFAVGFYHSVLPIAPLRVHAPNVAEAGDAAKDQAVEPAIGEEVAEPAEPEELQPGQAEPVEQPEHGEQAADGLSGQATGPAPEIPAVHDGQDGLEEVDFGDDPDGEEAA